MCVNSSNKIYLNQICLFKVLLPFMGMTVIFSLWLGLRNHFYTVISKRYYI